MISFESGIFFHYRKSVNKAKSGKTVNREPFDKLRAGSE